MTLNASALAATAIATSATVSQTLGDAAQAAGSGDVAGAGMIGVAVSFAVIVTKTIERLWPAKADRNIQATADNSARQVALLEELKGAVDMQSAAITYNSGKVEELRRERREGSARVERAVERLGDKLEAHGRQLVEHHTLEDRVLAEMANHLAALAKKGGTDGA